MLRRFFRFLSGTSDCANCNDIRAERPANVQTHFTALKAHREYAWGLITAQEYAKMDMREVITCLHCGKKYRR